MNSNINLTILTNQNGHRWIQDMTSAFYRCQVKDVVLNGEPKPEVALETEKTEDFQRRKSEWIRKDDIAKSLIYDSLSDDYKSLFVWTSTSSENLLTIKDKVLDNSASAMKVLRKELEDIEQLPNEEIMIFFNRWNGQFSRYRDAGGLLSEKEKVSLFITKLNYLFHPIVGPIISKENFDVSFKDLLLELKNYENFIKSRKTQSGEQVMFMKENLTEKNKKEEVSKEFNLNLVCYNCGGFGHRTTKCCSPKRNGVKLPHWNIISKKKSNSGKNQEDNKKEENHFVNENQQSVDFIMEPDEYPYPQQLDGLNNISESDVYSCGVIRPDQSFNLNETDYSFNLNEIDSSFNLNETDYSFNLNEIKSSSNLNETDSSFNLNELDVTILDSGSSISILKDIDFFNRCLFKWYSKPLSLGTYKKSSDSTEGDTLGEGPASLKIINPDKSEVILNLERAIYCPTARLNIISEGYLQMKLGFKFISTSYGKDAYLLDAYIFSAKVQQNLMYSIKIKVCGSDQSNYTYHKAQKPADLIHLRFAHQSNERIYRSRNAVIGLNMSKAVSDHCDTCSMTKSKYKTHLKPYPRQSYEPLGMVVLDYKGPFSQQSIEGFTGYIVFIDICSHFGQVFGLKKKEDSLSKFIEFKSWIETQTNSKIKCVRSDQAREIIYGSFADYLKKNGIRQQYTSADSQSSNGTAEARIRVINQMARSMIRHSSVSPGFWFNAVHTANYIYNRTLNANHGTKTPFELIFNRQPRVDYFRVFGCICYYYIHKQHRKTFDENAKRGRFVGYSDNSNSYLIYAENKYILSRHVDFEETIFDFNNLKNRQTAQIEPKTKKVTFNIPADQMIGRNDFNVLQYAIARNQEQNNTVNTSTDSVLSSVPQNHEDNGNLSSTRVSRSTTQNVNRSRIPRLRLILPPRPQESTDSVNSSNLSTSSQSLENLTIDNTIRNSALRSNLNGNFWQQVPVNIDAPRRTRSSNVQNNVSDNNINYIDEEISILESINFTDDVPNNYRQARKHSESEGWMAALQREYNQLDALDAFKLVPRNDVKNEIINTTTITFTRKPAPLFYKARLCFRGDLEKNNLSLEDTFASVIRTENLRLVLCMILSLKWKFVFIDIGNAFINAKMPRPVYIEIPVDHPDAGKRSTHVFKLNRALYGTNDAPKLWNDELWTTLKEMGYFRTKSDWNLFYKDKSFIVFHVDDGIISASNEKTLTEIVDKLKQKYKLKVQKDNIKYLKLNLKITDNCIYMDQSDYIEEVARKFEVSLVKSYDTPMITNFVSQESSEDEIIDSNVPYRAIIGSLLFIARQTRPDITFAVNYLSQYVTKPMKLHWNAAKRVLIYLYNTRRDSLRIGPVNNEGIKCYSDATWADCKETRRSRSGGVLFYNGTLISAHSHPQRSVSLSSTQAEYQALTSAIQEIIYYRQLLGELGYANNLPTPLFCDNQGALYLAVSTKNHTRIKHIELRFHYIRETVQDKKVQLLYINTKDQIADIMTKPLAKDQFIKFKS